MRAGNRIVRLLSELGDSGGRELLCIRDTVGYRHARHTIESALGELARRISVPYGELEDEFAGVELDASLRTMVTVGQYEALLRVTPDLRRVQTTWRDAVGQESQRRPRLNASFIDELGAVDDVRQRLRTHVTALRHRFERAMTAGKLWTADEWSARMFGDPLRAAMARRLIWRFEHGRSELVIASEHGLRNVHGERVRIRCDEQVALWHPADEPVVQQAWRRRLIKLGIEQPIEQVARQVTLADPCSSRLSFAAGERVRQTQFRGFLRCRGWDVPYLGRWCFVGEAAREVARHGASAVLALDLDWSSNGECPMVLLGDLGFRSELQTELDARALPPAIVSEAARDVLGAIVGARRQ